MAQVKGIMLVAALLANAPAENLPPKRLLSADRLVVATTAQLAPLLRKTATELQRQRPGRKVSILAVGSDVAMAELYTRRADLAVIGRAASDPEIKAFQWIFQYPPQMWPVLGGSVTAPGHSPAVRVLVHASNPIRSISTAQLQLAFRGERPVRWSDLGVTGPLAQRLVHPIMPDSEQGTGRFIRSALFGDATLFAWKRVREITEPLHRDGRNDAMGEQLADAVEADPQALAFVPGAAPPGTRTVRVTCLSTQATQPCDSSGMLARTVYAYSDPMLRPDARLFLIMLATGGDRRHVDPAPYRQLTPDRSRELLSKLR
jgi:phosphate transport system substrate-binding protein